MNDLYKTLDVPRTATAEEIKLAFRTMSKSRHPDAGGNEEDFKALQAAYEILSDPEKRARYDEHGIVENVDGQALQALQGVFDSMIENERILTADIVATANRILKAKAKDVAEAKKEADAELKKYLRLANRVRLKPSAQGGNVFVQVLTVKETKLRKVLVDIRTMQAVWKRASQMLAEHEHFFDEHLALPGEEGQSPAEWAERKMAFGEGGRKGFRGTGFTFGDSMG